MKKAKKKIRNWLKTVVEIALRKKCEDCIYNDVVFCRRNDKKGIDCSEKIIPVGWERKK